VNRVQEIKTLLKEEKYSIAGAKQVLSRKPELPLPGVGFNLGNSLPEEQFQAATLEPTIN
ncbi:MAG: hypothetical protein LBI10_07920, partial [Deltaproteobacteria bacterium]|nr:hypothetical protein [Deltaproteobacteria bacterium]